MATSFEMVSPSRLCLMIMRMSHISKQLKYLVGNKLIGGISQPILLNKIIYRQGAL